VNLFVLSLVQLLCLLEEVSANKIVEKQQEQADNVDQVGLRYSSRERRALGLEKIGCLLRKTKKINK
jgi:hypothetical protein